MSREVCGICWCPYDDDTGACACEPVAPPEAQTQAEKIAYCAGWWDALANARKASSHRLTDEEIANLWHQNGGFHHHFARAVERYLKGEK